MTLLQLIYKLANKIDERGTTVTSELMNIEDNQTVTGKWKFDIAPNGIGVTKSDVDSGKRVYDDVVMLDGDQTITGKKTFTNTFKVGGGTVATLGEAHAKEYATGIRIDGEPPVNASIKTFTGTVPVTEVVTDSGDAVNLQYVIDKANEVKTIPPVYADKIDQPITVMDGKYNFSGGISGDFVTITTTQTVNGNKTVGETGSIRTTNTTNDAGAVNKSYLDAYTPANMSVTTGDTYTAPKNFIVSPIVKAPVTPNEVVTKTYVDNFQITGVVNTNTTQNITGPKTYETAPEYTYPYSTGNYPCKLGEYNDGKAWGAIPRVGNYSMYMNYTTTFANGASLATEAFPRLPKDMVSLTYVKGITSYYGNCISWSEQGFVPVAGDRLFDAIEPGQAFYLNFKAFNAAFRCYIYSAASVEKPESIQVKFIGPNGVTQIMTANQNGSNETGARYEIASVPGITVGVAAVDYKIWIQPYSQKPV